MKFPTPYCRIVLHKDSHVEFHGGVCAGDIALHDMHREAYMLMLVSKACVHCSDLGGACVVLNIYALWRRGPQSRTTACHFPREIMLGGVSRYLGALFSLHAPSV